MSSAVATRLAFGVVFMLIASVRADAPHKLSDQQRLMLQNRVLALRVAQLELQAYVTELKAVCAVDIETVQCAAETQ